MITPFISLIFVPVLPAQTHPDFTGSWIRTSQSCRPPEKEPVYLQMTVHHREPILSVRIKTPVDGTMRELQLSYKTNGEELHYTGLDHDDFHSELHWEGSDLVFDIVELERGDEIHAQEIWHWQEQGTKLLRTKTENGPKEHSTCTAVFAKQVLTSGKK